MSLQSTKQPPLAVQELQQLGQIRHLVTTAIVELQHCLESDPTTEIGLELRRLFVGKYGNIVNALVRFSTLTVNIINLEQRLQQQLQPTADSSSTELKLSDAELASLQRFLEQTHSKSRVKK